MSKKEWYYFDTDATGTPQDRSLKLTELGASLPDVLASYEEFFEARESSEFFDCGE